MGNLGRHVIGFGRFKRVKINSIYAKIKRAVNVGFQAVANHYTFLLVRAGQVKRVFKYGLIRFVYANIFRYDHVLKIACQVGTGYF